MQGNDAREYFLFFVFLKDVFFLSLPYAPTTSHSPHYVTLFFFNSTLHPHPFLLFIYSI